MDLINHLNRNRNKDEIIEESVQNHLAYCCAPSWHSCKTDKVLKVAIPVDIPAVFKWKETDLGWNEGKMTEPHLQRPKKVEPIQWGCYLGARQWSLKPQSIILRPWNLWNFHCWAANLRGTHDPFIPSYFSDTEWEYLILFLSHLILREDRSLFHRSTDVRDFAQGWNIPGVTPIPDLDRLEDEMWELLNWFRWDFLYRVDAGMS